MSNDMHYIPDIFETFILSLGLDVDCVIIDGNCNVDFSRFNAHASELVNLFHCINVKPCITSPNHDVSFRGF